MSETEEKVPFISVGEDGLPHSRVYGVDGENVPASQTHLPRELVQFGSDPLTTDSVGAECRPDTDNVEAAARSELTKRDWLLVIVLGLGNLVVQAYYSLLGPFYAIKASMKGVDGITIGLIIGINELVCVLSSPILGANMNRIGAKFMYVAGIFVAGYCTILFGFMDYIHGGPMYIGLSFLIRGVEGVGFAALVTATFAILGIKYPDRIATLFGLVETFNGVGAMIGPPLGGALYQAGGFVLPFLVVGILALILAVVSVWLVPNITGEEDMSGGGRWVALRHPRIIIMMFMLMIAMSVIAFLLTRFGVVLSYKYQMQPFAIGLACLCGPLVYLIGAPLWGFACDRKPEYGHAFLLIGYVIGGVGVMFIGPPPFIPSFRGDLGLVIGAFAVSGFGIGACVITFKYIADAARMDYGDTLHTYGYTSAIINTCIHLGYFSGAPIGGYLHENLGFSWACFISAIALFILPLVLAVGEGIGRCYRQRREQKTMAKEALLTSYPVVEYPEISQN